MPGIRALFDTAVVLLNPIGEGAVAAVDHFLSQGFANRTRKGMMPIGRHSFWAVASDVESQRRSKRLASSISCFSLEPPIQHMTIAIKGSIQLPPVPFEADRRFIHVPAARLFVRQAWLVPDVLAMEPSALPPSRSPEEIQCRAARPSRPDPAGSPWGAAARRHPEGRPRWDLRAS